jgi:hypothetical protein
MAAWSTPPSGVIEAKATDIQLLSPRAIASTSKPPSARPLGGVPL